MSESSLNPARAAGLVIGDHLAEIAALFRPGMKLTLVARDPDHFDGSRDMVVTADDLSLVIAALEISRMRSAPTAED